MVIYWGRGLIVEPLSKCSWRLSNILFITLHPVTLVSVYDSTLLLDRILIFWSHQKVSDGSTSFKINLHLMFTAHILQVLTQPFVLWNYHIWILVVILARNFGVSSVTVCSWTFVLIFILLRANAGYLHFVSALYRCSSSCCNNWGVEQMVWVLWWRVPITQYLDGIVWWLSHCKYKSVWVCFLYTVALRLPSSFGVISMSKNGVEPSSVESLLVNWMYWPIELMWSKNFFYVLTGWLWRCHLQIFSRVKGVWWCCNAYYFKIFHI